MRAVVDTGILVRAVIKPQGSVGPVLGRLRAGHYTLIYSEPLLEELQDVPSRPRIAGKYGVRQTDVQAVLQLIAIRGEAVTPTRRIAICRDPDDNAILEAASAGQAGVIVTGDSDLLVLDPFEGIPIVGAAQFLARLG